MGSSVVSHGIGGGAVEPLSTPGWAVRALIPAVVCTLALFLAMPFLARFAHPRGDALQTLPIQSLVVSPIAPVARIAPPREESPPVEMPRPVYREVSPPHMDVTLPSPVLPVIAGLSGNIGVRLDSIGSFAIDDPEDRIFGIDELDDGPVPIVQLEPVYPMQARSRRIEGFVVLEFVVGREGDVMNPRVIADEPVGVFDKAALRAVKRWRFRPGSLAGEHVPVRVRQRIAFRMEN